MFGLLMWPRHGVRTSLWSGGVPRNKIVSETSGLVLSGTIPEGATSHPRCPHTGRDLGTLLQPRTVPLARLTPAAHAPPSKSVVLVVGAADSPTKLRSAVMDSLTGPAHHLVIDLSAVNSMDNAGVAVLVGARARQRARHQGLSLIYGRGSATHDALARTGLHGAFTRQRIA